jgi:hypothetical protein
MISMRACSIHLEIHNFTFISKWGDGKWGHTYTADTTTHTLQTNPLAERGLES